MALFKRRHFRVVLLEWLAYGMAFGAIAMIGACQSSASNQGSELASESPTDNSAEVVSNEPEVEPVATEPLPDLEFSEAIRADYNPVNLGDRDAAELSGEDPVAVTEGLFGAKEPVEGRYSESSKAELGNERAVVMFLRDNLADDSVQGIRTRVEFERVDGPWQVVWAGEQYRCREGRGQQDWESALCR